MKLWTPRVSESVLLKTLCQNIREIEIKILGEKKADIPPFLGHAVCHG